MILHGFRRSWILWHPARLTPAKTKRTHRHRTWLSYVTKTPRRKRLEIWCDKHIRAKISHPHPCRTKQQGGDKQGDNSRDKWMRTKTLWLSTQEASKSKGHSRNNMEQLENQCQRRIETNTQTSHSDKQPRNVEHWNFVKFTRSDPCRKKSWQSHRYWLSFFYIMIPWYCNLKHNQDDDDNNYRKLHVSHPSKHD